MVSRHLLLVLLFWITIMNQNCDGRKCEIYRNPIICCGRIKRKHLSFGRYFHLNMAGSFNNRDKESDIWTANPFKPRAAGCGWRGTVPSYPQYPVITAAGPSLPPLPGDIDICQPVPPLLPRLGHLNLDIDAFGNMLLWPSLHRKLLLWLSFRVQSYSEKALNKYCVHMSEMEHFPTSSAWGFKPVLDK